MLIRTYNTNKQATGKLMVPTKVFSTQDLKIDRNKIKEHGRKQSEHEVRKL